MRGYTRPMPGTMGSFHVWRPSFNCFGSENQCTNIGISVRLVGALDGLYDSINVPDTDIRSAWNLVNPSGSTSIGKDQALVFLHILNNRHEGYRIPRSVPASLRATFQKNQINYDLDKVDTGRSLGSGRRDMDTISGKKEAFGESYLTRLGVGGRGNFKHSGMDDSC